MENPDLQGIFGIVPTPLNEAGDLDEAGLTHLVRHCKDSGLHAAVILGSNGEFPYFSTEEKARVLKVAAKAGNGDIPLVAGVSAASTKESVHLARIAKESGYCAVMAAINAYFQVGLEAVKEHFSTLADEGGLPVIFYYFPETTGLVLAPDEIAELAALGGIHGAKITVLNRSFLKRVIKLTRTHLWAVFAGSSFLLRYSLKRGGAGIICPLPLIAPQDCLGVYKAMQEGDLDQAREIQDKIMGARPIFSGIDVPSSVSVPYFKATLRKPYSGPPDRPPSTIAMVKEALRLQGHPITAVVRRPAPPLTAEQHELVKKTLQAQGWL